MFTRGARPLLLLAVTRDITNSSLIHPPRNYTADKSKFPIFKAACCLTLLMPRLESIAPFAFARLHFSAPITTKYSLDYDGRNVHTLLTPLTGTFHSNLPNHMKMRQNTRMHFLSQNITLLFPLPSVVSFPPLLSLPVSTRGDHERKGALRDETCTHLHSTPSTAHVVGF